MRAFRLRKKRAQSVSLQDFYAVHFFDVKMLVCQQLILQVSHRLERCHFKSDYPDITLVLRHVHLYKKIFNFCWFWWEIIFTHKVWKPCPFNLDFWQCRSKSKFGDHISKLGLRKISFPVKTKEFRERTQTTVRCPLIVRLTYMDTWWWSEPI